MKIRFKKLSPNAIIPTQATAGSVGFDLVALEDTIIFTRSLVKTGIALELPNNMEAQIRSRSGLAMKGVTVANSPGTIDSDYRGEICVILQNNTSSVQPVDKGDKIAQLVFQKREFVELVEVDELDTTLRGDNGLGSSGK